MDTIQFIQYITNFNLVLPKHRNFHQNISIKPINFVQQSPFWEVNRFTASQELPCTSCKWKCSLPRSQEPLTYPCPAPNKSSLHTHTLLF
jgi:hypothetical protein